MFTQSPSCRSGALTYSKYFDNEVVPLTVIFDNEGVPLTVIIHHTVHICQLKFRKHLCFHKSFQKIIDQMVTSMHIEEVLGLLPTSQHYVLTCIDTDEEADPDGEQIHQLNNSFFTRRQSPNSIVLTLVDVEEWNFQRSCGCGVTEEWSECWCV